MVLIRTFTDADPVVAGAASGPLLLTEGWFFTDPLDVSGRDTVLLAVFGGLLARSDFKQVAGAEIGRRG